MKLDHRTHTMPRVYKIFPNLKTYSFIEVNMQSKLFSDEEKTRALYWYGKFATTFEEKSSNKIGKIYRYIYVKRSKSSSILCLTNFIDNIGDSLKGKQGNTNLYS